MSLLVVGRNEQCIEDIQKEYDEICDGLISASRSLPRKRAGVEKDWWSSELTQLRNQSTAIHRLWLSEGRPRQGPTHLERLRVGAAYKHAIRFAKKAPKQTAWNRLHSAMEVQDTASFWKWWRSVYGKNKSQIPPVVDGQSSKRGIASAFQRSFENNCKPNNSNRVDELLILDFLRNTASSQTIILTTVIVLNSNSHLIQLLMRYTV